MSNPNKPPETVFCATETYMLLQVYSKQNLKAQSQMSEYHNCGLFSVDTVCICGHSVETIYMQLKP